MMRVRQNGPNNFFIVQVPPRRMVRVRQSVAVSRFVEMDLEGFECVGRGTSVSVANTHRSFGNLVGWKIYNTTEASSFSSFLDNHQKDRRERKLRSNGM